MSDIDTSGIDLKVLLALVLGTPAAMIAVALLVEPEHKTVAAIIALIIGLVIGGVLAAVVEEINRERSAQADAKGAQRAIEGKIEQKTATTEDIAVLNMRKLDEYYTLNKQQARRSFNVSIGAVTVGFATLIFAARFAPDPNSKLAGSLGGVLMQFIGGGFFYLYNKSLDQLNLFYGKLISLQNTMLALQLCEKLTVEKEQTTKLIALELMKRSEVDVRPIQARQDRPSKQRKTTPIEKMTAKIGE